MENPSTFILFDLLLLNLFRRLLLLLLLWLVRATVWYVFFFFFFLPFVILSRAQRRTHQNSSYRMQAKRKSLCDTLLFVFLCHSMKTEQTRSSRVCLFTGSFQCNAQSIHICTDTVSSLFSSLSCLLTHFLYMCDAASLLADSRHTCSRFEREKTLRRFISFPLYMLLNQETKPHSLTNETIFAVTNRERNHTVHIASDQRKD